jgi:hypothetical protein
MRYESLLPFYHLIWRHWREKRWERFKEQLNPCPSCRVIDIGGCSRDWQGRGSLVGSVDLINLKEESFTQDTETPNLRSIKGNGCALEFTDQAYDIAYSNSVIEHVGDWSAQQEFAREVQRVGCNIWIQTPAYGCPVEPHYLGLFIHWFPATWHVRLARWLSLVGLTRAADLESIASTTRLLTKNEMQRLFPDCVIWTERLLWVFPKSYVAIRRHFS